MSEKQPLHVYSTSDLKYISIEAYGYEVEGLFSSFQLYDSTFRFFVFQVFQFVSKNSFLIYSKSQRGSIFFHFNLKHTHTQKVDLLTWTVQRPGQLKIHHKGTLKKHFDGLCPHCTLDKLLKANSTESEPQTRAGPSLPSFPPSLHHVFTHAPSERSVGLQMDIFSSSSSSSSSFTPPELCFSQVHNVSVRYRKRHGGAWVFGSVCHLVYIAAMLQVQVAGGAGGAVELVELWSCGVRHWPHLEGLKGPPQELEVGAHRAPYLLVINMFVKTQLGHTQYYQETKLVYQKTTPANTKVSFGTFLLTPASVAAWVNRWTFSPLLLLSHLQSFVSLRYRTFLLGTENAVGGGGHGSLAVYAILFLNLGVCTCSFVPYTNSFNVHWPTSCPPSHKCGLMFFHHCFYHYFPILDIIFYITSKKKREKWTWPGTPPPPLVDLVHQKVFFKVPLHNFMDVACMYLHQILHFPEYLNRQRSLCWLFTQSVQISVSCCQEMFDCRRKIPSQRILTFTSFSSYLLPSPSPSLPFLSFTSISSYILPSPSPSLPFLSSLSFHSFHQHPCPVMTLSISCLVYLRSLIPAHTTCLIVFGMFCYLAGPVFAGGLTCRH